MVLVAGSALYLAITWLAVIAWDIFDLFGWQGAAAYCPQSWNLLWICLFREAGPTEVLQWTLLATSVLIALHGRHHAWKIGNTNHAMIFMLLATGLTLMLLEDSLNVRHHFTVSVLQPIWSPDPVPTTARTAWEAFYYLVLALIMLAPVLILLRRTSPSIRVLASMGVAYAVYGLAAASSAFRYVDSAYSRLGDLLITTLPMTSANHWQHAQARIAQWHEKNPEETRTLGFYLMDMMVEESLELLGALLLLAALVQLHKFFTLNSIEPPSITRYQG